MKILIALILLYGSILASDAGSVHVMAGFPSNDFAVGYGISLNFSKYISAGGYGLKSISKWYGAAVRTDLSILNFNFGVSYLHQISDINFILFHYGITLSNKFKVGIFGDLKQIGGIEFRFTIR